MILVHVDAVFDYGSGKTIIECQVSASAISLAETQKADPSIKGFNGMVRLSVDGNDGKAWGISPFVQVGMDTAKQDSVSFGSSGTALTIDEYDATRTTIGAGANVSIDLSESGTFLRATGTALFHSGDTDAAFTSRFNSTSGQGTSFSTVGEEVEQQFILDVGIGQTFESGWTVGAEGFSEFGDLEGYGGKLTVGRKF